ncbi:MAG TPA: PA2169 family four-helix-bundle protein [Bryobacteraceae bacterium]|nr:PA2169 family four-helix-bundle protein [Bryobacteraceae bacterium]
MPVELPRDEVVFTLNELIETCLDGQQGFLDAATHATNSELKQMCMEYSRQRARFAAELHEHVRRLGGRPDESGSVAGALHRRWIDVKSAIVGRDDEAIVTECNRGEDVALARYREALGRNLPVQSRAIAQAQFDQISHARDRIRALTSS